MNTAIRYPNSELVDIYLQRNGSDRIKFSNETLDWAKRDVAYREWKLNITRDEIDCNIDEGVYEVVRDSEIEVLAPRQRIVSKVTEKFIWPRIIHTKILRFV